MSTHSSQDKTIRDFGRQWTAYGDNHGFNAGIDWFRELVEPVLPLSNFAGARVADIGSGTGRIVSMLFDAGAAEVTAVEPSAGFEILRTNVAKFGHRVRCIKARGEELPDGQFDLVVSIGVLHHIPDPAPTVAAAFRALRPGGRMVAWLYGREGNGFYLAFLLPVRAITKRAPHQFNAAIAFALDIALGAYLACCRLLPISLPLKEYVLSYIAKLSPNRRRLVIYDQINPEWSKYYTREEAKQLFTSAGFVDIALHNVHGYSWTIVGAKPDPDIKYAAKKR